MASIHSIDNVPMEEMTEYGVSKAAFERIQADVLKQTNEELQIVVMEHEEEMREEKERSRMFEEKAKQTERQLVNSTAEKRQLEDTLEEMMKTYENASQGMVVGGW